MQNLTVEMLGELDDTSVIESVPITEWQAVVFVGQMTTERKDIFELEVTKRAMAEGAIKEDGTVDKVPSLAGLKAMYAALAMKHENGSDMFTDEEAKTALLGRNSTAVARIYKVSIRLNPDLEELIKDSGKNSDADQDANAG